MTLYGVEFLNDLPRRQHWEAKCLLGDAGLAIFHPAVQHAQAGFPGLSFREGAAGMAIAGMLRPGVVELRFHAGFSDSRVSELWRRVVALPGAEALRDFAVTYQGRAIA
jgi:hypothetical protein